MNPLIALLLLAAPDQGAKYLHPDLAGQKDFVVYVSSIGLLDATDVELYCNLIESGRQPFDCFVWGMSRRFLDDPAPCCRNQMWQKKRAKLRRAVRLARGELSGVGSPTRRQG